VIFVDSSVFVIKLRYPRDAQSADNDRFLEQLRKEGDGATTLVNLLEVAGILSHDLNPRQLHELVAHFPHRFGVRVFPTLEVDASLPAVPMAALLDLMARRLSFGDALVLHQVKQHALPDSRFVTWDAAHFEGKTPVPVMTPRALLEERP
jgi:predicted nucleic acid-binding protein